jgi:hypothetical protein
MTIALVHLSAVAQCYFVTLQQILQQLLQKFVAEHQKELAGFLADLQQTEADIRQFHSYSDIERTES